MNTKKMDKNLDDLIVNLKLTKPTSVDTFIKMKQSQASKDEQLPRFNSLQQHDIQFNKKQQTPIIEDSVIIDNYNDFNCYSFYQLKQSQRKTKESQPQEFSFCHHNTGNENENDNLILQFEDDSLSRFSSIVDKLKTEGDSLDLRESDFFYSFDKNQQAQTDRNKSNQQAFFQVQQKSQNTERRHTQYFSDSNLKSNKKSYKNLAKKTFEHNFSKPKAQPIYAKLTLPADKQNIHLNSNISSKTSVLSNLSVVKSTYSSGIKKSTNTSQKVTSKQLYTNTSNKQKVKELNDKIRKENQIVYQSQFKQKSSDQTPLKSFKKLNIQPHKFSSYKLKLFG